MSKRITELFGSDVYTAYTYRYTWQCNQLAHALLGFFGATVVLLAARRLGGTAWIGFLFLVVPVLKDVTDYVVDKARAKSLAEQDTKIAHFPLDEDELIFDAVTDIGFWTFGVLLAVLFALLESSAPFNWSVLPFALTESAPAQPGGDSSWTKQGVVNLALSAIGLLLFLGLVPWRQYIRSKNAFDDSKLPFYFRLPQFRGHFNQLTDFKLVEPFLEGPPSGQHLVISGPFKSGKTTLATGIGCRHTSLFGFRRSLPSHQCKNIRYLTAQRFIEEVKQYGSRGSSSASGNRSTTLLVEEADFLVVDDVNVFLAPPSGNQKESQLKLRSSNDETDIPTGNDYKDMFGRLFGEKPFVWVVTDATQAPGWTTWLQDHFPSPSGRPGSHIRQVTLGESTNSVKQDELKLGRFVDTLAQMTLLTSSIFVIGSLLIVLQADRFSAFWFWVPLIALVSLILIAVEYRKR